MKKEADTKQPRWVDCAEEAAAVLAGARYEVRPEVRDSIVREAGMWAHLAYVYQTGWALR